MEFELSPEPTPNFKMLRRDLDVAWPLHFNLFGIIFALLMLFTLTNLLNLTVVKYQSFQRYRTFLAVNILLTYFSLVTSLKLLVDPYDSGEYYEIIDFRGIIYIFHSLRFACLTSSFCLIEISIIEVAKLHATLVKSKRLIFSVIVLQLLFVMILSICLVFMDNIKSLLTICQGCTLLFGLVVITVTFYSTTKILRYSAKSTVLLHPNHKNEKHAMSPRFRDEDNNNILKTELEKSSSTMNRIKQQADALKQTLENKYLKRITIISLITALFGLLLSVQTLYSIISVYMFSMENPNSWRWYISQTFGRLSEAGMVAAMATIVQMRNKNISAVLRKAYSKVKRKRPLGSSTDEKITE